jgi:hypothetical protein
MAVVQHCGFEMSGCTADISCAAKVLVDTDGIDVCIRAVKTTCFMYDDGFCRNKGGWPGWPMLKAQVVKGELSAFHPWQVVVPCE